MENQIDILEIDLSIRENFKAREEKIKEYRDELTEINLTINSNTLSYRSKKNLGIDSENLKNLIDDIENKKSFYFYISESTMLIEEYKEILNTPILMNFDGKIIKDSKRKKQVIKEYINIAKKYKDIDIIKNKCLKLTCNNCENKKDFEIDENVYRCIECGSEQEDHTNISSYKDIDRVNISTKYTYDRMIHFRDSMNQHQGKQNSTIDKKVYDDLEKQFENHQLLNTNPNCSKQERFKNITKEHILIFLKELGYTKHYENVTLIHYKFTGVKPDDISYLEDKLMDDFVKLTDLYDLRFKKIINRKNFMNTQHILFQLLNNRKHPCKKDDFNMLKTTDRKFFHDEICQKLFQELGWNYCSFI
jgi:hypothetical protein